MTEFRLMTDALDKVYEALDMMAEIKAGRYPGGQWCEECGCETNHREHPQPEEETENAAVDA